MVTNWLLNGYHLINDWLLIDYFHRQATSWLLIRNHANEYPNGYQSLTISAGKMPISYWSVTISASRIPTCHQLITKLLVDFSGFFTPLLKQFKTISLKIIKSSKTPQHINQNEEKMSKKKSLKISKTCSISATATTRGWPWSATTNLLDQRQKQPKIAADPIIGVTETWIVVAPASNLSSSSTLFSLRAS